jgi:hypothetical protein
VFFVDDQQAETLERSKNGEPVQRLEIEADGAMRDVRFDVDVERSAWIALRILPSSHTNPVFVLVGGAPIRANAKSATWCRDSVDACWRSKVDRMREADRAAAKAAYDVAREAYERIGRECERDR